MLFSRRRNNFAIAGLVLYSGALVAAVAWFMFYQMKPSEVGEARPPTATGGVANLQRQTATVVVPTNVMGRCRHLEFDNVTGSLREGATGGCADEGPGTGNSTQGRVSAIRDSFSKR